MPKVVTFVITSKIQWLNFVVIAPLLIKHNYSIYFISLDAYEGPFEKNGHINVTMHFHHTILNRPEINGIINYIFDRRFLVRFLPIFSMRKAWCKWLQDNNPDLVIFGIDHSILNSYMVHLCNKKHIKSAVLQDGYIPPAFWRISRWKVILDFIRYIFNVYIPYTPHPFKSGVLSIGVIGDECKNLMQKILPSKVNVVSIGSPRLDGMLQKKLETIKMQRDNIENVAKIVFIHTNTLLNTEIEDQQRQTLEWVCETSRKINGCTAIKISLQVAMHSGVYNIEEYRKYEKNYEGLVKLYSPSKFSQLIMNSDVCLTYSSTGIIDCLYIGSKVAIVTCPEIKKHLNRSVLHFGIKHVDSVKELIDLVCKAKSIDIPSPHIINKIANFSPGWDSIDQASKWIASLISI